MLEQHLHDLRHAAGTMEVDRHIPTTGLQVAQDGHPSTDQLEVVEAELHARRMGDGGQVQHRVRRTPDRYGDGHGVQERLARHDVSRQPIGCDAVGEDASRLGRALGLLRVLRGHGGRVREAHPHRLDGARHGVGCEHPTTRACAGAGVALDRREFLVRYSAGGVLSNRLERAYHRQVAACVVTWLDGASVDEHRGNVQAPDGHHGTGHVLVTPAQGENAVEALAVAYGLDGIGDDLARNQRVFHPLGAHRDAVGHGDRPELESASARLVERAPSALRERAETYVARRQVRVGVSDTDDRLVEVLVLESDRTEHRPIGSALHSFRHGTATSFPQCYLSLS